MADSWPVDLPQAFLIEGYSEGVSNGLLEYQPDTGPSISRRRSSANPRPLAGSFELSGTQLGILKSFVEVTLIGGSLPFEFPDPLSGDPVLVKFNKEGLPRWSALGGDYYTVSIGLWILP